MITYWIHPSLEDLIEWHENASHEDEIEVHVRCATEETVARAFRWKGLSRVSRDLVERLGFSPEMLDHAEEVSRAVAERQRRSGALDEARRELDKAGVPAETD